MSNIKEICGELFDRLTIIKGYLLLNIERKKVDYTPIILREVDAMEGLIRLIIDDLKKRIARCQMSALKTVITGGQPY